MHCDMVKIQDGVAIVEKLNYIYLFNFMENLHNLLLKEIEKKITSKILEGSL